MATVQGYLYLHIMVVPYIKAKQIFHKFKNLNVNNLSALHVSSFLPFGRVRNAAIAPTCKYDNRNLDSTTLQFGDEI